MAQKTMTLRKKIIIGLVVAAVVFGAIIGIIYFAAASSQEDVLVIKVKQADYGTNSEYENVTDGTISTGTSQTVTYDGSKLVESIPVHQGDHVKKGDVLVKYDTTQASLNVRQKELNIKIAENDLQTAKDQLAALSAAREVFVPDETEPPEEEDEEDTKDEKKKTEKTDEEDADSDEDEDSDSDADSDEDDIEADEDEDEEDEYDEIEPYKKDTSSIKDADVLYSNVKVEEEEPIGESVPATGTGGSGSTQGPADAVPNNSSQTNTGSGSSQNNGKSSSDSTNKKSESGKDSSQSSSSSEPSGQTETTPPAPVSGTYEWMDANGDTYSATELRKAKIDAENDVRSLTTDLAEAQMALKKAQKELDGNIVTAEVDGVVTTVNDTMVGVGMGMADIDGDSEEEEARPSLADGETLVQVSSFEGMYVNSALSEWSLAYTEVGDTVYVTDWSSGDIYPATITQIMSYASDYAATMYALDDSSASYFPYTAIIEEDNVSLSDGDSVEVSLEKPEGYKGKDKNGKVKPIYLYKAFVVSEGPKRYVYKEDEDGKLVKQEIEVSGQEPETYIVTGGITKKDYIAFPFGDSIREGATVREGDIEELYGEY